MQGLRYWPFLALVLGATGCNGSLPSRATAAGDWTLSSTIPLSARTQPFGMADKYLAKKNNWPVLYSFGGAPDGAKPESWIGFNRDNPNVPSDFGTTISGGVSNNGALYGLTEGPGRSWKESVLYSFKGSSSGDGSAPVGIAYRGTHHYPQVAVVTESGGTSSNGTFDSFDPHHDWIKRFTYSFGGTPDGAIPIGNPVVDKHGNIYGTTESGGAYGVGVVYRMQPKGSGYSESVAFNFGLEIDGEYPYGGLIMDNKGALYGTTYVGGSAGQGTVFKLTPSGSGYKGSTLYSFQGAPDGSRLTAGPCGGPNGSLYGTTEEGGTNNVGTVYKLTPSGSTYKETIVWNFGSVSGDGAYPYGGVIVDKKGAVYGTTLEGGSGGSSGPGTIFILTPRGSTYNETIYSFTGSNGGFPYALPSVDSKGYIYVTTSAGGTKGDGTVIRSSKPTSPALWTSSNWSGCE